MKLEDIKTLSDDELRIMLAELLGWTEVYVDPRAAGMSPDLAGLPPDRFLREKLGRLPLPGYCTDLNVIVAECRKVGHFALFAHNLRVILRADMGPDEWDNGSEDWWSAQFANATARQRAEAIFLTFQKSES